MSRRSCLFSCLKRRLGWWGLSMLIGAAGGAIIAAALGQAWALAAVAGALGGSMVQFNICRRECGYRQR